MGGGDKGPGKTATSNKYSVSYDANGLLIVSVKAGKARVTSASGDKMTEVDQSGNPIVSGCPTKPGASCT